MKRLLPLLWLCTAALFAGPASAGTLYLPAYPNAVLVFDEAKGAVVDRIPLQTGTPMSIRLAPDHKKIYVTTIDRNGIEVIDVATRKVVNHFVLNTPTKQFRFRSGAVSPDGKLFYTVTREIDRLQDHFDLKPPKYTVIDLEQQKILKTVDMPKEDQENNRMSFEVSPDGKYLYQFGTKIKILDASDFKLVNELDLSEPDFGALENVRLGSDLNLLSQPGMHISIFNSSDPIVHNRVFGLARLNLATREVDYDPIGPAPAGMAGVQVTPDKKSAYTVVTSGGTENKRCEFWKFDLATDRVTQRAEVPCRTRFSFGMSSDGTKLYIYGAGFDIEVYDAATLKYEKTWDLNNDVTYGGIAELP
jgi:DNA-binding beta-propeller fold protein YncE